MLNFYYLNVSVHDNRPSDASHPRMIFFKENKNNYDNVRYGYATLSSVPFFLNVLKRICFFMPFSGEIPAEAHDADNTRR